MLIEIEKTVQVRETVEVVFPYFYKHDLMLDDCDSVIYGKIDEKEKRSIQITTRRKKISVEIERENVNWNSIGCYLADEYKSNAEEYAAAKAVAMKEVESA